MRSCYRMNPTVNARRPPVPLDDYDAPIPLPRLTLDWAKVAGIACMIASAMVVGFLMELMWRLAVLDHIALVY